MSRAARVSLVGLCALLFVIGLLRPDPSRELTPTTFGTGPFGYQAVFELFETLGVPVTRSYDPPGALPADATVWWIEPEGVCRAESASSPEDAGVEDWRGEEWIAGGGTAVVFLSPSMAGEPPCASVAGFSVPPRVSVAPPRSMPEDGTVSQEISGALVARPRRINAPELSTFTEAGEAEVVASVGERPLALLFRSGSGRLVLVADALPLRNRWLDRADAAPFVIDLARAYGVPRFDERAHGMHRERHPVRFLLASPARLPLAGALLLALLFFWAGRALPPRRIAEAAGGTPVLDDFVASLARLYAGTGDHRRVLERYRQLAAARLRRHFALPPETPLAVLVERLTRSRRADPAGLALLTDTAASANAAELRAAIRALDAVVSEATR